jgi:hypothetical protein
MQSFPVDGGPGGTGASSAATSAHREFESFAGFVAEGMHHIAIGADHVLFLVTLLMVAVWRRQGDGWVARESAASAWRETLLLVSAFTLAHSLTLGIRADLADPRRVRRRGARGDVAVRRPGRHARAARAGLRRGPRAAAHGRPGARLAE